MQKKSKPYEKHVFICCNTKADGTGCAPKGGEQLRVELKNQAIAKGILPKVRINKSGCLDFCDNGIAVAVYPEGNFFLDVKPENADLDTFLSN